MSVRMRCARIAALLCAAALLASSAQAETKPTSAEDSSAEGLVLGFGKVLEPPYEFSGIGTPILYLNGLQFSPTPAYSKELTPIVVTPEIESLTKQMQAIKWNAFSSTQSLENDARRLAAIAESLKVSSLVDSVETWPAQRAVGIFWRDFAHEYLTLDDMIVDPSSTDNTMVSETRLEASDTKEMHASQMSIVWHALELGGLVAFGEDYFITGGNPYDAQRTRRVLSMLIKGERVKEAELAPTILKDKRVLASVLEANHIPKEAIIK
jgi:hypothetical protein